MGKVLLKTFEFYSEGRYKVEVYNNMLTIEANGIKNLVDRGFVGKTHIYYRNLQAVEQGVNYLDFIINGFTERKESVTSKRIRPNVISFSNRERQIADELIDLINKNM